MSVEIVNARSEPYGVPFGVGNSNQYQSRYQRSPKCEAQQKLFCECYVRVGTITGASREAGIDPNYHFRWLEQDPDYPARFKMAHLQASELLVEEGRRRAYQGVEEPTGWYKGEPGGFVKRYSDALLIFLIKGAFPDIYKDRHEHTGRNGGPIEVQSTVTIEQFPIWLKQAIVVVSSGVQIDPEVERVLMSHFEAKFLEAEKLAGSGTTDGQGEARRLESYHGEADGYRGEAVEVEGVVEVVTESGMETREAEPETLAQVVEPLSESRPNFRPYKRQGKAASSSIDMDDI